MVNCGGGAVGERVEEGFGEGERRAEDYGVDVLWMLASGYDRGVSLLTLH